MHQHKLSAGTAPHRTAHALQRRCAPAARSLPRRAPATGCSGACRRCDAQQTCRRRARLCSSSGCAPAPRSRSPAPSPRMHARSITGDAWHGARVSRSVRAAKYKEEGLRATTGHLGRACLSPARASVARRSDAAQHARSARRARAHTRASGCATALAAACPRRSCARCNAGALAPRYAHACVRCARGHHGGCELRRGGGERCSHNACCCSANVVAARGVAVRRGERPGQRRDMHGCAAQAAGCGCTPTLPLLLATSSLLSRFALCRARDCPPMQAMLRCCPLRTPSMPLRQ